MNSIQMFIRDPDRAEFEVTHNGVFVVAHDTLYGLYDGPRNIETPRICITQSVFSKVPSELLKVHLAKHLTGQWASDDNEIREENDTAVTEETTVYDMRHVNGFQLWFITIIGHETVVCFPAER